MALTVAQLVARLTADTSGFYRSMAVANASMIRTGTIVSRVAAGVGLATLGMGFVSVRAAGNFEQAMNIVQATSDATGKQMKQMSKEAISLGADLKLPNVSAKDAADAMVELSKGGLTVNQVLKATRGTLQLGLAANIGFADSATIVARTLKNFGLEGGKASMVANLLAAGANKSTAEITDLAYGLQNAGGQFQASGMSVNTLVVALAELADKGLSGEYAGTALKTMLVRLSAPTKEAGAVMKQLGIEVFTAEGKMKTMPQIIKEFQDGTKGLTQQQKLQALTTIFGVRANQAMIKLLQGGQAEWNKYKDSIVGTNAAQKLTEARTKGFNGAMQGFGSAVETLAIQLGTALLPALTQLVRGMTNFVNSIDPNRVIGFFSAIFDGIRWVKDLAGRFPVLNAAIKGFIAGLVAFLVIKEVISMIRGMTAAMIALNAAMYANPVVLVIAALVALGVALVVLYQRSETFRAIVQAVFQWMKDNIPPILDTIRSAIETFVKVVLAIWNKFGGDIMAIVKTFLSFITNTFKNVFQIWKGVFDVFAGLFTGDWSRMWDGLKAIFGGIWAQIGNILKTSITIVGQYAKLYGKAILEGIIFFLGPLAGKVAEKFTAVWNWLSGAVTTAFNFAKDIGLSVIKGIINGVTGILGAWKEKMQATWIWIKGLPDYVYGLAKKIGGAFLDGIIDPIKKGAGRVKDAGGWLLDNSLGRLTSYTHGYPIGKAFIRGLTEAIAEERGVVKEKAGQFLSQALELVALANSYGEALGKGVVTGILREIAGVEYTVKQKLQMALDEAARNALQSARQKVLDARGSFASAFGSLADAALAAFDAAVDAWVSPARKRLAAEMLKDQIKALNDAIKESKATLTQAQADAKVASDEYTAALLGGDPEKIKEAKDKLDAAQKAVAEAQDAYDRARREKFLFNLEQRAQDQETAHAKEAARDRVRLQERLQQLQKWLSRHPEEWGKMHGKVSKLLQEFGITAQFWGTANGIALAAGLRAAEGDVRSAAKLLADAMIEELDIIVKVERIGKKAKGKALGGPVRQSYTYLVGEQGPELFTAPATGTIIPNRSLRNAGGPTNIYITVEGNVRSEHDFALTVRDILSRRGEANAGMIFR